MALEGVDGVLLHPHQQARRIVTPIRRKSRGAGGRAALTSV